MNRKVTPCALQVADPVEQPVDGGAVELGGRLVEDDEPGAEGQRAGDLDELPLLDGQLAGRRRAGRRPPTRSASSSLRLAAQRAAS